MKLHTIVVVCIGLLLQACTYSGAISGDTHSDAGSEAIRAGAPLFAGMGDYHRTITTSEPLAQRYFNQGMVLAFGFNHAESIRSFRAAQRLDPDCAMCFWGEALATGPNINVTSNGKAIMAPTDRQAAFAAIQKALALRTHATQQERALISALGSRYDGNPTSDRDPLDNAWALSMRNYTKRYPTDDDAAAIYAEAWMNTMPWDYWSEDGSPRTETVEVINTLEEILQRSPRHPLALHLYIHATEASANPGRAESAADRLRGLVPGSGHLVHMPAHIYWRVGRYHDAADANVRAAGVDEEYIAQCNAQGFYPALYYPHNIHFLWAATSMAGQSQMAISSARKVAANVHMEQVEQFPTVEFFKTIPLLALTQFGRWQEILSEPAPPSTLDYSTAIWHYARGTAYASTGDLGAAQSERDALRQLSASVQVSFLDSADYPASLLLSIADNLLQGEMAMAQQRYQTAVHYFGNAVAAQDSLPYTEPPFWYYPSRQSLGLAHIKAGNYAQAEAVYRQDLEDYPRNGWSMFGLIQSLEAQGEMEEAQTWKKTFSQVWSKADIRLKGSRI